MTLRLHLSAGIVLFAAGFGLGYWAFGPEGAEDAELAGAPGELPSWDPSLGVPPRFTDVTESSGVDFRHENGQTGKHWYPEIMGSGVAVFDYDGDGLLDLYFVNGNRLEDPSPEITNRLYRNEGGWRFRDVTGESGTGDAGFGQGCSTGDYDRDGDLDLFVTNLGPNVLYRNDGNGTFTEVGAAAGLRHDGWGETCSFLDYDGDGWLDLYVQNYLTFDLAVERERRGAYLHAGSAGEVDYPSPLDFRGAADRLYRNEGDGTFTDVTERAGVLRPDGKGMGLACIDLDGDRLTDVFVANDSHENYLFMNRGEGRFEESAIVGGVAFDEDGTPEASMGVDAGDYDGDGLPDLIVPSLRQQVYTLYRNLGEGRFRDVSIATGLARATSRATGFNANFLDYDRDGDLDLFFTVGGVRRNETASSRDSYEAQYGDRDILLANDGRGRFTDVSRHAGPYFAERRIGRGSAAGDLDNDGDLDLVVSNLAGRPALLRNDTSGGNWLQVELVTADGLLNPLGAEARVEAGGRVQRVAIHGGVTYLSQNDRRLAFGLGSAARAGRLHIRWPSGREEELRDLVAGRLIRIEEGSGTDPGR